jgi:16S rRNA processing protein RimM
MPDRLILLGVVGRPHGVRGLVHVHSYTANPADLAAYGPLRDDAGRCWSLAWRGAPGVAELRDAAGRPLPDRSAAERMVNARLFIERDRLPAPEDEEFYLADLVGLDALAPDGTRIGTVALVHDYGAGTFLEIARDAATPLLLPFTRAAVPEVDLEARRLTVVAPAEIEAAPPAEQGEAA